MPKDYYAVLGMDRDATDEEIKAVYREAVKECHPDVAGNDPEKTERFKEITEAYKVLIDPYRRRMHDKELPLKSYPLRRPTAQRVWKEVVDVIMLRSDRVGPFQLALQAARPLALEEDRIILGFHGADQRSGAYLDVAADRRRLLSALQLVMGREFGYRYIQGDNQEDWERIKAGEARVTSRTSRTASLLGPERSEGPWEELMIRLSLTYNGLPKRQYPQIRAEFLLQAVEWLCEAEAKACAAGIDQDTNTRSLAKAIERLAGLTEVAPVIVAMELARLRDPRGSQA